MHRGKDPAKLFAQLAEVSDEEDSLSSKLATDVAIMQVDVKKILKEIEAIKEALKTPQQHPSPRYKLPKKDNIVFSYGPKASRFKPHPLAGIYQFASMTRAVISFKNMRDGVMISFVYPDKVHLIRKAVLRIVGTTDTPASVDVTDLLIQNAGTLNLSQYTKRDNPITIADFKTSQRSVILTVKWVDIKHDNDSPSEATYHICGDQVYRKCVKAGATIRHYFPE